MKRLMLTTVAVVLATGGVYAQDTDAQIKARAALDQKMVELNTAAASLPPPTTNAATDSQPAAAPGAPPLQEEAADDGWEFNASAYTYLQKNDRDYVQPTFVADRGWLHLEARYNYEDFETASLWAGYNFRLEREVTVVVTPMAGVAFGETEGVAPGFRLSLEYARLSLDSEGEYFFDSDNSDDGYFYNWTELNYDLSHGFRLGLVMQKETSEEVRRGFQVGFSWDQEGLGEVDLCVYFFDLDRSDEMFVFGVGFSF